MRTNQGAKSLALFALSVLFLFLLTLFESSLLGLSITTERILSLLLLVVPAVIGVVLGARGLQTREERTWMSALGLLLNTLFALFHLFVIAFAG